MHCGSGVDAAEVQIPQEVLAAMERLEAAGHVAYLVGGCTRDSLMGQTPKDYDMTTDALPEETEAVFAGERVIGTGLRHGTVTVLLEARPVEITTFRVDGSYSDGRHPDAVRFSRSLEEDLARRDFTMNAVAWRPREGYVDPFGGAADIANRRIRCVGAPEERFAEDALRILRALRFSSVLDFAMETRTEAALRAGRSLLERISSERVAAEVKGLLCGKAVRRVLMAYPEVLGVVLPELLPLVGLDQHSPYHCYDAWEHTAAAVEAVPAVPVLRLAALLHDVGKPACFTLDGAGMGHFYGHPEKGAALADGILRRLRLDNATRERAVLLVAQHHLELSPGKPGLRRAMHRLGGEAFFQLLELKRADALAHAAPCRQSRLAALEAVERAGREAAAGDCMDLRTLAVGGDDLLRMGMVPGPQVGAALHRLLALVMEERVENEKPALLACLRQEAMLFPPTGNRNKGELEE